MGPSPNSANPPLLFLFGVGREEGEGGILFPFTFLLPLSFSNLASPYGGSTSPFASGAFPLLAHIFCRGCPEPLPVTRYVPGTLQNTSGVRIPSSYIYINHYLSTISRLLVMSVISSGTPNNIRSPNHITHIIQYPYQTLSVRTLRVRELCRHD